MSDEKHDETGAAPEAQVEPEGAGPEQEPEVEDAARTDQPAEEAPDEPVTEPTREAKVPATAVAAPPPPFPAERRLVRRPEGKIIAGVCSGIAAYFGLDPVIVRVAAVLLAVFGGGVGLVAYVIAWLVMPMAPEGEPIVSLPPRDDSNIGRWIGIGAIVLGAIVLFHNVFDFRGGIFWGLLLVGLGIALWGRELAPRSDRPDRPTIPPVPPTPPSSSAVGTNPTTPLPPVPPVFPPTRPAASAAPAPSPARREPSLLGRAVVGAAALAVGIALLLDNTDVLNVTPKGVVAVLLLIVGTGLVIGTWIGRARWLIIPGLVLTLLLALLAILPDWQLGDGAGERLWQPRSLSQVRSDYRLGAGELLIDLSEVEFAGRSRNMEARVGFGELIVIVPKDITVDVEARVGAGEADLFRRTQSGLGVNDELRETGERGAGRLDVDAQVGFGQITIRRAGDTADLNEFRRGRINIGLDRGRLRGIPGIVVDTDPFDEDVPAETGAPR